MLAKGTVAAFALAMAAFIGDAASTKPVNSATKTYSVPLSGQGAMYSREVPGPAGDSDGSGLVKLSVDLNRRQICYDFDVSALATPLMAHIHKAPLKRGGPSVVTLFTGPGAEMQDCLLWTEKWLAAIVANPSGFYVTLYTVEYPDGAVRGQLIG